MNKGNAQGKSNSKFALVVFMLIGIGLAIAGVMMTVNRKQKDSYYGTVTGKVTDMEHYTNSDDEEMYSAVYTYYVNDVPYTYTDNAASSQPPTLGKLMEIRYNPLHPNEAYVAGKMWPGILLIGMGVIFVLASTLGFINGSNGQQTEGRKLASGLIMGIIVSAMGWGILALSGDSIRLISVPGIVLCMFGVLGLFVIYKSIKDYVAGKRGEIPADGGYVRYDTGVQDKVTFDGSGAAEKEYGEATVDFGRGQGEQNPYSGRMAQNSYDSEKADGGEQPQSGLYNDSTYQYSSHQGSTHQESAHQDNPVMDFYREHKQGIDTTIKTVQKGRNIYGCVTKIIAGTICVLSAVLMFGASVSHISPPENVTAGSAVLVAYIMPFVIEVIFVVVGIYTIVKGIKGLSGKE